MNRTQRYGTHIPILIKAMQVTNGPVLEMGSGFASTPILYWLCKEENRKFVSYDNDKEWIEKSGYPIIYVDSWDKADIENVHWSVVFLDHRPGDRRIIDAARIKDNADVVILHDSEPDLDKFYLYRRIYPLFKYRFDYNKFLPNTVVLSNYLDVQKLLQ